MYSSTTEHGDRVAATGLNLEPIVDWTGERPRPTVIIAPGTVGQGDQCAPSRVATTMIGVDPVGLDYLERTETQCIADSLVSYGVPGALGPEPSRALTVGGETLGHHLLPIPAGFLQGQSWIMDRFNGVETSGCHFEE